MATTWQHSPRFHWGHPSPGAAPTPPVHHSPCPVSQVHLHVGPEVLVDIPLQMDGQVRDAKDGPVHVHQPLLQLA